jgi:hypothetical protein
MYRPFSILLANNNDLDWLAFPSLWTVLDAGFSVSTSDKLQISWRIFNKIFLHANISLISSSSRIWRNKRRFLFFCLSGRSSNSFLTHRCIECRGTLEATNFQAAAKLVSSISELSLFSLPNDVLILEHLGLTDLANLWKFSLMSVWNSQSGPRHHLNLLQIFQPLWWPSFPFVISISLGNAFQRICS